MKRAILLATALCCIVAHGSGQGRLGDCPADFVNPLMGTMSKRELSSGNTYPAIALPWGMNCWMPQTGQMGDGWAYVYTADKIRGFKQTHQPSPWINDYGQFAVMPETLPCPEFHQDRRASWFSHKAEEARPYYYKAYLADYDVQAEIVPAERAAMMRVTYPATEHASFVVDALDGGSFVKIVPEKNMVVGYTTKNDEGVPENFKNYFVLVFDHPFSSAATVEVSPADEDDYGQITAKEERELACNHAGAILKFGRLSRGEQVLVRIASSFISFEQAEQNLKELGDSGFEVLKEQARQAWNEVLGVVEINDTDIDRLRTFYSCLYRAVLFPRKFYEVDQTGEILHYSPYNGQVRQGYMFTDTGFWDTFRSLFPLLNLLYPSMNTLIQEGLVNAYAESGFLPEWASPGHRACMVGNNSASVVADAWLKGQRVKEPEVLWEAVTKGANAVHPVVSSTGRRGFDYYNKYGYVPYDVEDRFGPMNESVARTLEYAYDDWCIYRFGRSLGKSEEELLPYKTAAFNYRNVFDPTTCLMRGRNKDGTFRSPFSPLKWGDAFTEGNAWHYTWSVFHDPEGLIRLMGGKEKFSAMLDSVFRLPPVFDDSYYGGVIHEIREMQVMDMGNYAHGNQPIQHAIYLYDWSGQPWKAQQHVRQVMDRLYRAAPDGYCGDEDNGQTSAWYVFSAMGFYPVCPGSGQYALGTPCFREMKLHLENGRTIEISSNANRPSDCFINELRIDGIPCDKNFITHEQLLGGARLEFDLSDRPNTVRGTSDDAAPYSFSRE